MAYPSFYRLGDWLERFSSLPKVTQWVISLEDLNPGLFWAWVGVSRAVIGGFSHPETSSLKLSFIYLVFLISLGFSVDSKEIQL